MNTIPLNLQATKQNWQGQSTNLDANLAAVKQRIELAAIACGRHLAEIKLLAVSKTQSAEAMYAALRLGQKYFAENYVQEALTKKSRLEQIIKTHCNDNQHEREIAADEIEWHFIGHIQNNKTRLIAENFNWVHSIDQLKTAVRLSLQRPAHLPPLEVCVEVNISNEKSKSGCSRAAALDLCSAISSLPNLRLRGLMLIPDINHSDAFFIMRQLFFQIRASGKVNVNCFDTLSMGMSADIEPAIAAGSTIVRIGSAIFGKRYFGKR